MMNEQDAKRRDEFKNYELEKGHERREKMKNMTEEERIIEETKFNETHHKPHEKIHEPVSVSLFFVFMSCMEFLEPLGDIVGAYKFSSIIFQACHCVKLAQISSFLKNCLQVTDMLNGYNQLLMLIWCMMIKALIILSFELKIPFSILHFVMFTMTQQILFVKKSKY